MAAALGGLPSTVIEVPTRPGTETLQRSQAHRCSVSVFQPVLDRIYSPQRETKSGPLRVIHFLSDSLAATGGKGLAAGAGYPLAVPAFPTRDATP